MSAIQTLKSVFNGGELSPMLDARVDSEKYASGCRELTNFIPSVYGGIKKRPGTELLGSTKNNGLARLHSFKRSTDTNYILEFGHQYLRFWKGGDVPSRINITVPIVAENWIGSELKVEDWYPRYDFYVGDMVVASGARYICIQAHSASDYEYQPPVASGWAAYWRLVIPSDYLWTGASRQYYPGQQREHLGIAYECISAHISDSSTAPGVGASWTTRWRRNVPFLQPGELRHYESQIYICVTAHYPAKTFPEDAARWRMSTAADGLGLAPYEIATPFTSSQVYDLQFTQLNDVLFIAHPDHHPKRLTRRGETDWVLEDVPFQYAPVLDVNEERVSVQVQFEGIPPFGNPWRNAQAYQKGDRVHSISGSVGYIYECIADHTSSSANQPGASAYWELVPNQRVGGGYKQGDRVTAADIWVSTTLKDNPYFGVLFTCHTSYNPSGVSGDEPGYGSTWANQWNEGTGSIKVDDWAGGEDYVQGDKARRGKVIYECLRAHRAISRHYTGSGRGRTLVEGNQPGVSVGWVRYWRISSADSDFTGLTMALHATEPIFTAEDVGTVWQLELGTGGIVSELSLPSASGAIESTERSPIFIQGGYTLMTSWTVNNAFIGTITVEESLDGVLWSVVRQYTQTQASEGNINSSGEAPATGAWYRMSAQASATTDASKAKLEATSSILRLPFKVTGFNPALPRQVIGELVMPGGQMPPDAAIGTATSIFRKPAFSAKNGFPRAVTFHDSRLWWGGTKTHPTRMWASQTEDYYIYLGGSLDTDGLDLTLATVEANTIQWMASFNRALVIGTSGDEWTVDSGDVDAAMTPTNLRAHRRTRYGSTGLPPQLTGDALLWVRRGGGRLHEFAYVYERDGFSAPDLTLLAEHMLRHGPVYQTAFTSCPDPILWVANEAYLTGMSYNREHNVTAWHKHSITGGSFKSVAGVYGGHGVDELWFVTFRDSRHWIERMHPKTFAHYHGGRVETSFDPAKDACFLDGVCAGTGTYHSASGLTIFTGFKPLRDLQNGSTAGLVALLEGQPLPVSSDLTFDSLGNILLTGNHANKKLILGNGYVKAAMQSMNLEVLLQEGTSQGRNWRLIRVIPNVWRTRTFSLTSGSSTEREVTLPAETTDILDEIHFSGNFEKQLNWGVKSENAYPCNLLGTVLKFEVTGG